METQEKQLPNPQETTATPAETPPKKLSKAEQRIVAKQMEHAQRANRESDRVLSILCSKFRDFFVTAENPEGDEVREKIRQVHGQWMVHCKAWNIMPAHHYAVKKYCENLVNEYKKDKLDNEVPPEENNSTKKIVD